MMSKSVLKSALTAPVPRAPVPAAVVGQGSVRVAPLLAVPDLLIEKGCDPVQILSLAGLDAGVFGDPDNIISFAAAGSLLTLCAAATSCPHFGLLTGERAGASNLGLVGFLVQNSPDVGTALRNLLLHLHLHDQGAVPTLETLGRKALLGYAIYQRRIEGIDQITDTSIAIGHNILRQLCGKGWTATEVLFAHARPKDIAPYQRIFRAPVHFDAEQSAIVFSADWLAHKIGSADPLLRHALEKQIAAMESLAPEDLAGQLRRALRTMLVTGRGSVEQVEKMFSLHRRTLNRRLHAQGISFHDLVNEVRYEIARQLLEGTRLSLAEIAATLDYSDPSAFTRAFKRWSGEPPTEWRANRGRAPAGNPKRSSHGAEVS
jgi:AraC-like DNA-binding protein